MGVSGVGEARAVEAGLGQPKEGIPNLLREDSEPGRTRWNGKVRTFHRPGLASLDDVSPETEGRCFFLKGEFSSSVICMTTWFDPSEDASRVARLDAATPCSP